MDRCTVDEKGTRRVLPNRPNPQRQNGLDVVEDSDYDLFDLASASSPRNRTPSRRKWKLDLTSIPYTKYSPLYTELWSRSYRFVSIQRVLVYKSLLRYPGSWTLYKILETKNQGRYGSSFVVESSIPWSSRYRSPKRLLGTVLEPYNRKVLMQAGSRYIPVTPFLAFRHNVSCSLSSRPLR